MPPKVSVILTCFNKANFIEESVYSVLNQVFKDFEIIIVDDHSTDTSVKILQSLEQKDSRIKLILNTENKGANYCRNTGVAEATGQYLIFLDGDDLLSPLCLEQRVKHAELNKAANLLVFTMGVFHKKINDDARLWIPKSRSALQDFLKHDLPWSILQPFWKRSFFIELSGFDESFQRLQDVELHTRALLSNNINYKLIEGEPDCFYRIDEARKNYDQYNFLLRWVSSAVQYCNKFYPIVPVNLRKYLAGTIYQTHLSLMQYCKTGLISNENLRNLENILLKHPLIEKSSWRKAILFLSRFYNLHPVRIPGINLLLKKSFIL